MTQNARRKLGESLMNQHHVFTNLGNYWRDYYLLSCWSLSEQAVVYLGNVYNGYKLQRRLGDWCWLTEHLPTRQYFTLKFLPRSPAGRAELKINEYIQQKSGSPYLSIITDHFEIPHHLASTRAEYKDIKFNVIAYPVTGTDLRRYSEEGPGLPLSFSQKKKCIRELVLGLADLHRLGVVHGDIHAGNAVLPAPPPNNIANFLTRPPIVNKIRRKDGQPTDPILPQRVTEPIDIGFGEGTTRILDFGHAFVAQDGAFYTKDSFARGTPRPPELVREGANTKLPFQVDSWHLGLAMYFILTSGARLVDIVRSRDGSEQLVHIDEQVAQLRDDKDEYIQELPNDFRNEFKRILLCLLQPDPKRRLSILDLAHDRWLGDDKVSDETM